MSMDTTGNEKKLLTVPVPQNLSADMVKVAKQYVQMRIVDGLSIGDICKRISISTKTFYKFQENDSFKDYLHALESSIVSEDEIDAYNSVRKYILKKVSGANPTDKHVEMFLTHFKFVVDSENHKRMSELGISNGSTTTEFISVEERKKRILERLSAKD